MTRDDDKSSQLMTGATGDGISFQLMAETTGDGKRLLLYQETDVNHATPKSLPAFICTNRQPVASQSLGLHLATLESHSHTSSAKLSSDAYLWKITCGKALHHTPSRPSLHSHLLSPCPIKIRPKPPANTPL